MKKNNKKGFTLAELLIVVAIIGVLAAISIPVFSSQLEKAKEATDVANIRAAYAEVVSTYLTDGGSPNKQVELTQGSSGWVSEPTFPANLKVSNGAIATKENVPSSGTVTITGTSDGATIQ